MYLTNLEFLRTLFEDAWPSVFVTSFDGDPNDVGSTGWGRGGSAGNFMRQVKNDFNNFFTISTFSGERRRKSDFVTCHVLVIDDVGTSGSAKVHPDRVLIEPTYKIETSPGNEQWGYKLETPVAHQWMVDCVLDGLVKSGLCSDGSDPGMKGVTRNVRMPDATNQKAKYKNEEGHPFRCRLVEWVPERAVELAEIAAEYEIVLIEPAAREGGEHAPLEMDPIVRWLAQVGRYHGAEDKGDWVEHHFQCFWLNEHTGCIDNGTGYRSPGMFSCFHGHCLDRSQSEWWAKCNELGGGAALDEVKREKEARAGATGGQSEQEEKFNPVDVAEEMIAEGHYRLGPGRWLWRYDHGVYRPDGEAEAHAVLAEKLGRGFRQGRVREVIIRLCAQRQTIGVEPLSQYINLKSGLLDWESGEEQPHDPEVLSTVQLPWAWDPAATCPNIDAFIISTLGESHVEFFWELAGAMIYSGNPWHKAVMFLGGGRNGKSVALRVLTGLVGARNCSSVTLQSFGESRFATAELYGKLANVSGDIDSRSLKRTDIFKMMTGEDRITGERKNKDPFDFVSKALPIFSANEPPGSHDQTPAFFARWIVVKFDRTFTGPEVDRGLAERLTQPHEMRGALVKAVAGLGRLMARGGEFALPEAVQAAGDDYRERLDSVIEFARERCAFGTEWRVPRADAYRVYREYTTDCGRHPVSNRRFYESLGTNFSMLDVNFMSHGVRYINGMKIALEPSPEMGGAMGGKPDTSDF